MERKSSGKLEILILALAMIFPSVLTYIYFVYLADSASVMQKLAYGTGKTIQFALPVFWIGIVCRERWLVRRFAGRGIAEGTVFGLLVFAAMLVLFFFALGVPGGPLGEGSFARTTILERIRSFELDDGRIYILLGLFYSLIHSGLEEYYWRWFVFGRMCRFTPWLVAAIVSGLGFMAHHIIILGTYFGYDSAYCWLGSVGVAVGGFYWAWLYRRSDSIWGPWISHGVIDAAIFTIGFMIVCRTG